MTLSRASSVLLPAGAVAVAVAWPLSAYLLHPAILPVLIAAFAAAALVIRKPQWGVALVIALAPLTNAVVAGIKPLHLALPAIAGAVLVYGLLVRRTRLQSISPGAPTAVLLFCGAAGISSLFALDPSRSLTKLFIVITGAVLFFAVLQVADRAARLEAVVAGALLALLIAAVHGIGQQVLGQFGSAGGVLIDGEVLRRVQGSFGHPNQYGGFLAVLMPLAVAVALTRGLPDRLRLLATAAALLAVQPLLFSFTRGAIVALVAGSLVWLAVLRPRAAVASAVAIAVLGFAFAPATLRERLQDDRTGSDIGLRADIWKSALDIYGDSPIVGAGLNNFGVAYAQLPSSVAAGTQRRLLHNEQVLVPPHANNLVLNVLAEQGVVGLAALLLLVGAGITLAASLSRAKEPLGRALSVGLGAGLLVMAAHSLLEITLFGEVGLPLFALLGAAAAAAALELGPARAAARPAAASARRPSPIPRPAPAPVAMFPGRPRHASSP